MKRCIHCGVPWPGDDSVSVDDMLDGKPDLPICTKAPPKDRWLKDSGINGHAFKEEPSRLPIHVGAYDADGRRRAQICLVAAGELAMDVGMRKAVEAFNLDSVTCQECRAVVEILRACRTESGT